MGINLIQDGGKLSTLLSYHSHDFSLVDVDMLFLYFQNSFVRRRVQLQLLEVTG